MVWTFDSRSCEKVAVFRHIDHEGGPQTTITGTVFEGNVSGGNGGGVFVNGQTVSITDTVFRQNVATSGGAWRMRLSRSP